MKTKIKKKKQNEVAPKLKNGKLDLGELRQDVVTGKWVAVAIGRAQRPADAAAGRQRPKERSKYKEDCPFCNLEKFPQRPDILRLPDNDEDWQVHIFGNKYPAFSPREEFRSWQAGPYRAMESVGYHEVLATRWHNQSEAKLSTDNLALQIEALVLRYRQLKKRPSVNYIQIIRNHGPLAGGSQEHPHHQIFTVPVLPSDITDLLGGAELYFQQHGEEAFAALLAFEGDKQERIIEQNEHFTAFCPFASRVNFQVTIMPNKPEPYFENMGPAERASLAEIMSHVFKRLYVALNDPDFNYFIHSAPCDDTGFVCNRESFKHFRWHIEIIPRLQILFAGFELGTGLEIITSLPEESAAYLRDVDISKIS